MSIMDMFEVQIPGEGWSSFVWAENATDAWHKASVLPHLRGRDFKVIYISTEDLVARVMAKKHK